MNKHLARSLAGIVMTFTGATGVSAAMLVPLVTVETDATSTITPGQAPAPNLEVVMTLEDKAAYPACEDIRTWPKSMIPVRLLVIRSNGERAVLPLDVAFAAVEESKMHPELSLWTIGACGTEIGR